jgi:Undecaprenyl-phosphate glucose phosphotransferase
LLKQRHQTFVALLCLADACVVAAAALGAWGLRRAILGQTLAEPPIVLLRESLLVFVIPTTIYLMWAFGLYRPRRDRGVGAEMVKIVKSSLASIVALVVLLFLVGAPSVAGWNGAASVNFGTLALDDGRLQMLALAGILPVALSAERLAFRLALRAIRRRGRNLRHVAIIGSGRLGQICCRTLDRNTWTGIHVAYFVSHNDHARPNTTLCDRPIIGGLAELEALMERHRPDAVYLALPNARASMMPGLLRRLEKFPIDVRIIPDVHPRYTPLSMSINELDGMPILSVRESPLEGLGGFAKRVLDFCGSLLALVLFAPVMATVALAVRMSSPGPVIFRQKRVSLGGEAFEIYKFRTMLHVEDEFAASEAAWTARNDPRVTPLGRWLRATSLDELPQLFNVLKGDMSLVGPRPERPELIQRFREDWRGYVLRQHVKAGITGWAQVNGLRGDTSLRKRLQLDLFYIRHWSLGFDLKILWLTLFRGFIHKNAH